MAHNPYLGLAPETLERFLRLANLSEGEVVLVRAALKAAQESKKPESW